MFFNLLEKLGRKKIVLDRGPSHPEYNKAKPWMERYYILFRKKIDEEWIDVLNAVKKEILLQYKNI